MNIYKTSLIGFVLSSLSITLPAQNSAVVDAIFYQKDSNFVKAKEAIDKACMNEKTLNKILDDFKQKDMRLAFHLWVDELSKEQNVVATIKYYPSFRTPNSAINFQPIVVAPISLS